jgi:hypothetical protein
VLKSALETRRLCSVKIAVATTSSTTREALTVNGDNFRHDSVVNWNGSALVKTVVSTHQLFAVITAEDIAQPGTVAVFVFNPREGGTTFVSGGIGAMSTTTCGGKSSNTVTFAINP